MDFVIGLVNSVLNLPDQLMKFFWRGREEGAGRGGIQMQIFLGPTEMTFGLVHASYRLPEW